MKLLRLFPLELGRLLHSRMTWLIVLLTVISPAVGLVLYKPAIASTMLSMYLANPALAGGAAGGILFGLLTVYELDRAGRSRVEVLTNAVVSPLAAALVRLPGPAGGSRTGAGPHHAGVASHQLWADRLHL